MVAGDTLAALVVVEADSLAVLAARVQANLGNCCRVPPVDFGADMAQEQDNRLARDMELVHPLGDTEESQRQREDMGPAHRQEMASPVVHHH